MLRYPRLVPCLAALLFLASCAAAAAPKKPAPAQMQAQKQFSKAVELQKAGKLDAAMREYRALLKLNPNLAPVLRNMGLIYEDKKDLAGAQAAYTRALTLEPRNEFLLNSLTRVLLDRGKPAEALKYARKLLGLKPKDFGARFLFGAASLKNRDFVGAADAFRSALHVKPDDKPAMLNLCMCYLNLKKYGDALERAEILIKLDPNDEQALTLAAFAAEKIGDRTTAIKYLEAAAKTATDKPRVLLDLSRVYAESGQKDKSLDALRRILKVDKTNFVANFNLGKDHYENDRLEDAEASFAVARNTSPNDLYANIYLALTRARLGKGNEALPAIQTALKIDPKNRFALDVAGYVREVLGKLDDAVATYRKWEKYYPTEGAANRKIANVYAAQGKKDQAYSEFEKAIKKNPTDADTITNYAMTLRNNGEFDRAYTQYERALKVTPKSVQTMLDASVCLQRQSKFDDAIALLNKAVEADPESIAAYRALADVYKAQDKPDQVTAQYKKILEFAPKDVPTLLALAQAYDGQKDYEAEIGVYRKLRELEPKNTGYAVLIAQLYDRSGKVDQAIEEARKLVTESPKEVTFRSTLAGFLLKKQDYAGALEQYGEIAKLDAPGAKTSALEQMGDVYEKQGKTDDAIASYKKALGDRPDSIRALGALARIYESQKKTDEFLGYVSSLVQPGKDDLPYRYYYEALKKAGKADEALKTLQEIAAKNPNNVQLASVLASSYKDAGQKDKAVEQYKKVLVKKPDDPFTNRALGDLYKELGRDSEAAGCLAIALKTFQFDKALVLDLGSIYEKLGQNANALKVYRGYLRMDPANDEIKKRIRSLETGKPATPEAASVPEKSPEPPKK